MPASLLCTLAHFKGESDRGESINHTQHDQIFKDKLDKKFLVCFYTYSLNIKSLYLRYPTHTCSSNGLFQVLVLNYIVNLIFNVLFHNDKEIH